MVLTVDIGNIDNYQLETNYFYIELMEVYVITQHKKPILETLKNLYFFSHL